MSSEVSIVSTLVLGQALAGRKIALVVALRPQTPCILGAAGHIILTPANQLMEEYFEPPEQSCL
jgi:hypothetical protein